MKLWNHKRLLDVDRTILSVATKLFDPKRNSEELGTSNPDKRHGENLTKRHRQKYGRRARRKSLC